MKFCEYCDNMLYLKLSEEDKKLLYHCKSCNHTIENDQSNGSICVLDNNYIDDNMNYRQYINKYLKNDVTLPRVTNIVCPNKECSKPKDADNEVIFLKYDYDKMKYLYHCTYCEHFWN